VSAAQRRGADLRRPFHDDKAGALQVPSRLAAKPLWADSGFAVEEWHRRLRSAPLAMRVAMPAQGDFGCLPVAEPMGDFPQQLENTTLKIAPSVRSDFYNRFINDI
jgi:hypothetical protein